MSSRTETRRATSRRSSSRPWPKQKRRKFRLRGWINWWPVLAGIAVTPIATMAAERLAIEGSGALSMLYPYGTLLRLHALHLSEATSSNLSQLLIYVQFPLYGIFMAILLRVTGAARALFWTALLHIVPVAVALITARA